jgi:Peptidase family M28
MFLPLLLSLTIDGDAAMAHASRLAALGPHPWGSSLDNAAAQYVAGALREAGLKDVRLQAFERAGTLGTNVVGTLPGGSTETVLLSAHHDSAPGAPGAYDDGGGVGILIEMARAAAAHPSRPRRLMFVSFDAEEGWARGAPLAGSRAFVEKLGPEARSIVAMIAIHPLAYADPLRPGEYVITPAWLTRELLGGTRSLVPPLAVGDPYISWLYQPVVRTAQVRLYGDDQAFLERGIPGIMTSDSSFSAFYPDYHAPTDTADKLDAESLARMGSAVAGMLQALEAARPGDADADWLYVFDRVIGRSALLAVGFLSLLPLLVAARGARMGPLVLRVVQAGLFGVLLWRAPVPAVWAFTLVHLLAPVAWRWWLRLLALTPLLAAIALAGAAARRGIIAGLWLRPWETALFGLLVVLALAPLGRRAAPPKKGRGGRAAPKPPKPPVTGRRRGLPKRK